MIELVRRITIFVLNPIIQLLLVCAVAYFIFGIVRFMVARNKGEDTATYSRHLFWGIIGLVIMLGVFGIMRLIATTIDADDYIEITDGGDIQIDESAFE